MTPETHKQFINRLENIVPQYAEFIGVAIGGSWIDCTIDQYSDLDIILIYDDIHVNNIMLNSKKYAEKFGKTLTCFTGEHVNESRLLVCLYEDPLLQVDFKFVAISDLAIRVENPDIIWDRDGRISDAIKTSNLSPLFFDRDFQWIEDRFWFWIFYATTKIGRGEMFETLRIPAFIQLNVLGPLVLKLYGFPPKGLRRLEFLLPDEEIESLSLTVASHDKESCLKSLAASIKYYQYLREKLPNTNLNKRSRAEEKVIEYFRNIEKS